MGEVPPPVLSTLQPITNSAVKGRKNLFTAQTSHQDIIQETVKTTLTPVNNNNTNTLANTTQYNFSTI